MRQNRNRKGFVLTVAFQQSGNTARFLDVILSSSHCVGKTFGLSGRIERRVTQHCGGNVAEALVGIAPTAIDVLFLLQISQATIDQFRHLIDRVKISRVFPKLVQDGLQSDHGRCR